MTNSFHALILAKSKSNRFAEKNTRDFHGVPMFLVNTKKCLKIFDKVFVSSDSQEMLDQAKRLGAIPILRGEELCGDVPNIPCYKHALKHMGACDGIVAVQANSPTIESNLIVMAKKMMEMGFNEVMTCDKEYNIYGSIWALTRHLILNYPDPYRAKPDALIVDMSTDIHTEQDYLLALKASQ
jgi:CMP-N-acetylneuraminic acid synthetase